MVLDTPTYHVLLIGIDVYHGVNSLSGCVNDIDAIQGLLLERLGVPAAQIRRLAAPRLSASPRTDVPSELPTLANIHQALRALASEAVQPGDRVLIYYSGHGTQLAVVGVDGKQFMREALLPTDHRYYDEEKQAEVYQYLHDWELYTLLRAIGERTSSVSVILDACCSHGATRDLDDTLPGRNRYAESSEPFIEVTSPPPIEGVRGMAGALTGGGQALVVAACLADERARELDSGDGRAHGVLTRALLEQWAQLPDVELSGLRWGRIWRPAAAAVNDFNPIQHPWISGGHARLVFGGPPEDGDLGYGVRLSGEIFHIDAGSLSGVTEGATLAVYPSLPRRFPPLGSPEDEAARICVLRVIAAQRASATATAVPPLVARGVPAGARARLIAAGEPARLRVATSPADDALAAALRDSGIVSLVAPGEAADARLVLRDDARWALTDELFGAGEDPDEVALPTIPRGDVVVVARFVAHYYQYTAPRRLAKACLDLPQGLDVRLLDCNGVGPLVPAAEAQDPRLPECPRGRRADYEMHGTTSGRDGDRYCIRVENTTAERLHLTVLASDSAGSVHLLASRDDLRPGHRKTFWYPGELGRAIEARLSDGQHVGLDQFVVVGTTSKDATFDHLVMDSTFADVLGGSDKLITPAGETPADRWTATALTVRTTV